MRNLLVSLLSIPIFAVTGMAQAPAPAAVLNPASNTPAGLPNSGIAQGAIFVVYGSNLGPATLAQASLPLPTSAGLGGTSIQVTVGGITLDAPIVYTLATQVAGVLPSNTPTGTGTMTVNFGGKSGTTPITVVKSNFGISTVNQTGTGPAVITRPDYTVITATNAAKPGETLVLWGTGLGAISGGDAVVPAGGDLGTDIQLYIGGQTANLSYRGRSGFPGLDQINFVVPQNMSGCAVSLATQTGAVVSNFTTLPIATNGGACSDITSVPISTLPTTAGNVRVGSISLYQSTSITPAIGPVPARTTTSSGASADFLKYPGGAVGDIGALTGQPSIGGCSVYSYSRTSDTPTTTPPAPPSPVTIAGLDAGPSISLSGPSSLTLTPLQGELGSYSASSDKSLPGGQYQVSNGPGGADVGAFSVPLTFAAALNWTNQASAANVDRTQPFTVTWTGGDASSYALIEGSSTSSATNAAGVTTTTGATFICLAPVATGRFTIPTTVLLSLPKSVVTSTAGFEFPSGFMIVGSYSNPQSFKAPGLDYAFANAGSYSTILMNYK